MVLQILGLCVLHPKLNKIVNTIQSRSGVPTAVGSQSPGEPDEGNRTLSHLSDALMPILGPPRSSKTPGLEASSR